MVIAVVRVRGVANSYSLEFNSRVIKAFTTLVFIAILKLTRVVNGSQRVLT